MKGRQAHLIAIELVNKRTIKTVSSITNIMGCHIMKGLLFIYILEKDK